MAHEMQVEIEGDSLHQPPATSAEQQSMLGLGQTDVVNGGQQVTLDAPLADQQLVQGEGRKSVLASPGALTRQRNKMLLNTLLSLELRDILGKCCH